MYVPLGINCWCVRVIEKPVLGIMSLVLMGLNRKIFLFAQQIKNSLTTCCQLDMSQSAFTKRTSCVCTFLRNNVLPICPLLVLEEHGEAACGGILQSQKLLTRHYNPERYSVLPVRCETNRRFDYLLYNSYIIMFYDSMKKTREDFPITDFQERVTCD